MKNHDEKDARAGGPAATAGLDGRVFGLGAEAGAAGGGKGRERRAKRLRRQLGALLAGPERSELAAFGYSLTGNWDEAEELVQSACFKALRSVASCDEGLPLLGWLKTILRNAYYDSRRRARLNLSLDSPLDGDGSLTLGDSLADSEASIESHLEREGDSAALREAVAALPRAYRRLVTLCDLEGLSYEAAAARLGAPVGTVRSRLFRARRGLRRRWQA